MHPSLPESLLCSSAWFGALQSLSFMFHSWFIERFDPCTHDLSVLYTCIIYQGWHSGTHTSQRINQLENMHACMRPMLGPVWHCERVTNHKKAGSFCVARVAMVDTRTSANPRYRRRVPFCPNCNMPNGQRHSLVTTRLRKAYKYQVISGEPDHHEQIRSAVVELFDSLQTSKTD